MEDAELMAVTRHMLDYMRGHTPSLQIEAVVHGQLRPFFSDREILHMVDVYDLFMLGNDIRNLAAAWFFGTIGIIGFMRAPIAVTLAKAYQWVIGVLLVANALLISLIAIDFDHAFRVFHEIFFNNDLWILDPTTDLLINIVPLPFFITLSVVIAIIFHIMLVLIFITSWAVCKRARRGKL